MKNTAIKLSILMMNMGILFMPATTNALNDALKIRISGNNYTDETVIRFVAGATNAFDGNWDAWKYFSPNSQVPSVYSRLDVNSPLSVNAYPELGHKRDFELFTVINYPGTYTLQGIELGAFASDVCIRLEDMQTNTFYNLRDTTTAYSFTLGTSDQNSPARFRVIFSPAVVINTTPTTCFNANDGTAILGKPFNYSWSYVAYDVNGNTVASNSNVSEYDTLATLLPGTYTLSVTSSFGCLESQSFTVGAPPAVEANFFTYDTVSYYSSPFAGFYNLSQNADSYMWDFGDGSLPDLTYSPMHYFPDTGTYVVTLTATGNNGLCTDTYSKTIQVLPDTNVYQQGPNTNPSIAAFGQKENEVVLLRLNDLPPGQPVTVEIYSANGTLISKTTQLDDQNSMTFIPPVNGFYVAVVHVGNLVISKSTSFIR